MPCICGVQIDADVDRRQNVAQPEIVPRRIEPIDRIGASVKIFVQAFRILNAAEERVELRKTPGLRVVPAGSVVIQAHAGVEHLARVEN